MGIEEMLRIRTSDVRRFVLDRLFTHSLFKINAAHSGSTITTQKKL